MKHKKIFLLLICFIFININLSVFGSNIIKKTEYPVLLNNKTLFVITRPVGAISAENRAKLISKEIKLIADKYSISTKSIKTLNLKYYTYITLNNENILAITNEDAKAANKSKEVLGYEYQQIIQRSINSYRAERNVKHILAGLFFSILGGILLFGIFIFIYKVQKILIDNLTTKTKKISPIKYQKLNILSTSQILSITVLAIRFLCFLILISLSYLYFIFVLSLFPWSNQIADNLISSLTSNLTNTFLSAASYIPNIFIMTLFIILAKYVLNFLSYIFKGIETEKLHITGFYKEWANPTFKIVQFFIWALTLSIIFPYLPGSDTQSFKAISVFIGALITLGSSTSVSNIMSGIIITYTRAFNLGDRLKIADTFGDVIEKNLLVTRIKTLKNEIISIPNSIVLQSHIVNYSLNSDANGLILHTSVTIGYDSPWRQVHELLIKAALDTENILKKPVPFVLETALNDFYITYEINAYTNKPNILQNTYSELHQNIQDKFNESGVEIMSPHYNSVRNGNKIAIPESYIAKTYMPQSFNINLSNN